MTRYQATMKARKALREVGCPYWPEPTSPQALAWLDGYAARQREVRGLFTDQVPA